jgi:hypothetical protein
MVAFRSKADIGVTGSDRVEYEVAVCHDVAANVEASVDAF